MFKVRYALATSTVILYSVPSLNGESRECDFKPPARLEEAMPGKSCYTSNAVSMVFNSFSPSVAIFVQKKMVALYKQHNFKVRIGDSVMVGSRKWRNLMLWMQHIHRDRDNDIVHVNFHSALMSKPFSQNTDRGDQEMAVLTGMCLVASGIKGMSWKLVKQALDLLRYGLVRCDRQWEDESGGYVDVIMRPTFGKFR
jgi:hypothetical protein